MARLEKLVKVWREEANDLRRAIRQGQYVDQTDRILMNCDAMMLERCARKLQYHLKKSKGAK